MGLGGARLGNLFAELADTEAHDTVTRAWQEGIRLFDTAPIYGRGDSERRMGEVLREYDRDGFVLSTKVGRLLEPCAPDAVDRGRSPRRCRFSRCTIIPTTGSCDPSRIACNASRRRVSTSFSPTTSTPGLTATMRRDARIRELIAGGYKALVELRDQGVVKAIGAGLNE